MFCSNCLNWLPQTLRILVYKLKMCKIFEPSLMYQNWGHMRENACARRLGHLVYECVLKTQCIKDNHMHFSHMFLSYKTHFLHITDLWLCDCIESYSIKKSCHGSAHNMQPGLWGLGQLCFKCYKALQSLTGDADLYKGYRFFTLHTCDIFCLYFYGIHVFTHCIDCIFC